MDQLDSSVVLTVRWQEDAAVRRQEQVALALALELGRELLGTDLLG